MAVHTFTNTTGGHLVLGGGKDRVVVAGGASAVFDASKLIQEDLSQISAGDFTVVPALPASAFEAADQGQAALNSKLIDWVISNDTQILFVDGAASVSVDTLPHDYAIQIADGDGTLDSFNDFAQVTVGVFSGSGTVNTPMPLKFDNGQAIVNLTRVSSSDVFRLSAGPAGIDISSQLTLIA